MGEIFQFRELVFEAGGYKHCFNFNWRTFDKIFGGGEKIIMRIAMLDGR